MNEVKKAEIDNTSRLLNILSLVNDWLKFAETKHAMLIAFNGASIYGLMNLSEMKWVENNPFLGHYILFVIIFCVVSVVVGILSFIPQLMFLHINDSNPENAKSSIYFGHLKNKSEKKIFQGICETNQDTFSSFEMDIAHQIQQNSNIAANKFDLFTISAWLTIIAYVNVLAFILGIILWANRNNKVK